MAQQHGALAQAPGAGGADKVFLQHLQHGRACHARQHGCLHHGQCQGRQQQAFEGAQPGLRAVAPAVKTAGREPAQMHGKHQHQQQGQPKARHGHAQLAHGHHKPIAYAPVLCGGKHAGRQRQATCQQHGKQSQRQGQGQPLRNQMADWAAVGMAGAHLPLQQAAQPMPVAQKGGLVQAQLPLQRTHGFGGSIRSQHDLRGIAGQHFQHGKNHGGCQQQGKQQCGEAFEQKQSHAGNWV